MSDATAEQVTMGGVNEDFQDVILPVITAFAVYNVVGFIGNLTVLFVFFFRYPGKQFRCLVLALSLVDFTSCCTTVPMETVLTWYWFSSPSKELCKAKNFFVQFTGLSAMYMLFVTSVFKYRQICKPFGKQLDQKLLIILCFCGISSSLLCAIPAAFLWDINNHTVTVNNVTELAMICEVRADLHDTSYPAMYRHLLSLYDVFLVVTVILYVFVARATIIHCQRIKKQVRKKYETPVRLKSISKSLENEVVCNNSASLPNNGKTETSSESRSKGPATQIDIRKVLIMVIIAGTFSVTFLMALTFGYVFAVRDYKDYTSVSELVLLFCCYRFYFINYALNPVVYFSLDRKFRKEVINLVIRTKEEAFSAP